MSGVRPTKICPFCQQSIDAVAVMCPKCKNMLTSIVSPEQQMMPVQGPPRAKSKPYAGNVVVKRNISKVANYGGDGTLRCPKCGGTNFTAKRSMKGKIAVGLLAPKTRVKCVTCGKMFKRG